MLTMFLLIDTLPIVLPAPPHVLAGRALQLFTTSRVPQLEQDQELGSLLHAIHDGHGDHPLHLPALALQIDRGRLRSDSGYIFTSGSYLQQ